MLGLRELDAAPISGESISHVYIAFALFSPADRGPNSAIRAWS
jgi:hypothetical protein